ncbi:MAG: F0F1 ATP synthase subunit gamma [Deltaproteobacteria bacterium]|nr:F0F1 ATP synthase subunit gamma [Deltaproteobacteria bacterium]
MANLKELRLRIATVKNTRKITAAMSQIASARLRKAQNALMAARPYGERMQEVAQSLAAASRRPSAARPIRCSSSARSSASCCW